MVWLSGMYARCSQSMYMERYLFPRNGLPILRQSPRFWRRAQKLTLKGVTITVFQSAKTKSRGISVVEILIALGVLAVIVSFASTSFSTANNKAELQAAVDGVNFSIQGARSTARVLETAVIMHLETNPDARQQSISFSFPDRNAELGSNALPQEFQFPADVFLMADESSVHFDSRGMVAAPIQLRLISKTDERISESVLIQ